MEYKIIKGINQKEFSGLYEMSKDGLIIRIINDKKSINVIQNPKALLTSKEGVERLFGLRTMYRFSWHAPLPYETEGGKKATPSPRKISPKRSQLLKEREERSRNRASEKAAKLEIKEEKAKRKALKNSFKIQKGKLISKFNRNRLVAAIEYAESKGNKHIVCEDKKVYIKVLLKKEDILLLRIESSSAKRTGYFFYNIENEKHLIFEKEIHKPGYGNDAIIWPKLAA